MDQKRVPLSLSEKIKVLDRIYAGEKVASIAKTLQRNESTIRSIKSNEVKMRTAVIDGRQHKQKRLGSALIDKMECALMIWINEMDSKGVPLSKF